MLRYTNIQEAAVYQVRLLQGPKDFTRHPLKEQSQRYTTNFNIEALLAHESGKQKQRRKWCIYCQGDHCSVYVIQISKQGEIS